MGADLRGVDLRHVVLAGAVYDSTTLWPERFNPGQTAAMKIPDEAAGEATVCGFEGLE